MNPETVVNLAPVSKTAETIDQVFLDIGSAEVVHAVGTRVSRDYKAVEVGTAIPVASIGAKSAVLVARVVYVRTQSRAVPLVQVYRVDRSEHLVVRVKSVHFLKSSEGCSVETREDEEKRLANSIFIRR